jgi:hypothetical protein
VPAANGAVARRDCTTLGAAAMTDGAHRFKVGQTVGLVPSLRSGGKGDYQIVSLRPSEDGTKQYRIKSKDEAYERVVAESDLVIPGMPRFDAN